LYRSSDLHSQLLAATWYICEVCNEAFVVYVHCHSEYFIVLGILLCSGSQTSFLTCLRI